MFKISFLFLYLLLRFSSANNATATSTLKQNCGESFQLKLKEILAIRESCHTSYYENCCQLKQLVSTLPSGVYSVRHVAEQSPFSPNVHMLARCDMKTDGGGWFVIQRRLPNGKVDFVRKWADYENGFGDLKGEFWYGLRNIHALTYQNDVELRIDMVFENDGSKLSWTYTTFKVAGASSKYRLTVGGGEGTGRDSFGFHNGQMFTTIDNDNDRNGKNCGILMQGGWWYNTCYLSNLNGPHKPSSASGIIQKYALLIWHDGKTYRKVRSVEMKVRAKKCKVQKNCQT